MMTLAEIDCADKTILHVYNKIDQVVPAEETGQTPNWLKKSRKEPAAVYISAYKKINIDMLRKKLLQLVKKRHYQIFPNYLKSSPY